MDLFFSPLACSMSSRIAFAEAGAQVSLIEVDSDTKTMLATGEDYRAINPLGYVPALRLDDGSVLTENVAILQYVADAFPEARLAPPESDRLGRARLQQWLSFISSELHKGLMTPLLGRGTPPEVKGWTAKKYSSRLVYLNDKLAGEEFLLENFSVADAYLATVLNWTQATPEIDLAAYQNVKAYLERMRQRPTVAAALATEVALLRAEVARRGSLTRLSQLITRATSQSELFSRSPMLFPCNGRGLYCVSIRMNGGFQSSQQGAAIRRSLGPELRPG